MTNLGVYCETLSPAELSRPDILELLGRHRVTLGHAIRFEEKDGRFAPDRVAPYLELAERLREAGGKYAFWPLLPKSMGYWINERNIDAVERMTDALLEGCRRWGAKPDLVVADVETPWQQMEQVFFAGPPPWRKAISFLKYMLINRNPRRFAWATARLSEIVRRLQAELAPVSCAVFPFLVADLVNDGNALQDYLEMPVFPVPFDAYNVMFYNSYIPAAVPMLVPPDAASRFLFEYAGELAQRRPGKAWVTLGSTWEGVLPGNEGKVYTRPEQLADDVAAAKAAGIEHLWLYCLEGVLYADQKLTEKRTPKQARAFFEVLQNTEPRRPPVHPIWSSRRPIMERLLKDRFKKSYPPK